MTMHNDYLWSRSPFEIATPENVRYERVPYDTIGDSGVAHATKAPRVKIGIGAPGKYRDLTDDDFGGAVDPRILNAHGYKGVISRELIGYREFGTGTYDLWNGPGSWYPPTQAQIHDISSDSAGDNPGGSGAGSIVLHGIDSNGDYRTEEVILNGTSDVPTQYSYSMIHEMYNSSDSDNTGNIDATAQTDGTVTARIPSGGINVTQQTMFQIPANHRGAITNYWTDAAGKKPLVVQLMVKIEDEVWIARYTLIHYLDDTAHRHEQTNQAWVPFPPLSIIKMRMQADDSDNYLWGGYGIICWPNTIAESQHNPTW